MPTNTRHCPQCRGDTTPSRIEEISGEEKPLAVTVHDFPVLVCEKGHRTFVRSDFAAELLDKLVSDAEPKLPAGQKKGLIFKHYFCSACGGELEAAADHHHTYPIDVAVRDAEPFRVDLTVPVYRCAACGREQVHSLDELRTLTPAALAHAFQAAGIPSG